MAAPTSPSGKVGPRLLPYGDLLRVAAAAGVCVFHVASSGNQRYGKIGLVDWLVSNVAYSATIWCVPVFVMLSGALLLDPARDEPLGAFYGKRLRRIGIPFAFWCLFYLAHRVVVQGEPFVPSYAVKLLLSGRPFYHLHFAFIIVGLYLFTPAFRAITRTAGRGELMLFAGLALGLGCAYKFTAIVVGSASEENAATRFVPYIGFYFAGYCLRDTLLTGRGLRLGWAAVAGSLLAVVGGQCLAVAGSGMASRLGGNALCDVAGVTLHLAVFVVLGTVFTRWRLTGWWGEAVGRGLAPATLGVYLMHPALLHAQREAGLTGLWPNAWVGIPLGSVTLVAASFAVSMALMSIPYVRRVVS
ncbi:MAG: hypothetical protein FJ290_00330 [Planctomycetes bacterium]|nr:hypothetical protein [Planctomycetota bacterium]